MNNQLIDISSNIDFEPVNLGTLEYADNPQPRCPVVLLVDCSYSMNGAPIRELQQGLSLLVKELTDDRIAKHSVELCIIPFSGEVASVQHGFSPLSELTRSGLQPLTASGMTPMGKAIQLGISEINNRRKFYKRNGLNAYLPTMLVMTDGHPTDNYKDSANELNRLSNSGKINSLCVGVGDKADMDFLTFLATKELGAHKLKGLQFIEFFRWLSDSLKNVTSGSVHDQKKMASTTGYQWTDIL